MQTCLHASRHSNTDTKIFQFGKIRKYLAVDTRILVYKQTILPLVEYVSFMLCLNSCHELDKLQKLQNRCLRLCMNINNPRDISVARLHNDAWVSNLSVRRDVQLVSLMFDLKCHGLFKKEGIRNTRSTENYIFETDIVHTGIYAKSPYYKGANLWNEVPRHLQQVPNKGKFKKDIKRHLGAFCFLLPCVRY